jgi:hypothetical protein
MNNNSLNPQNFEQECTTVWSFARRGKWATHNSKYRGNVSAIINFRRDVEK